MNKFQLYLSLIFGVLPYDHLNMNANKFLSYWHMYLVPLCYLTCFGVVRLASLGMYTDSDCETLCSLADTIFLYLGFFIYVPTQFLAVWRGKKFFTNFPIFVKEIDEHIARCVKAGSPLKKEESIQEILIYYGTWFVVVACFAGNSIYNLIELSHFLGSYSVITFIASAFPYFACSITLGQFIFYLAEISTRFQLVNDMFKRISDECDRKNLPIEIFDIEAQGKSDLPINQAPLRLRHNVEHIETVNEYNDTEFYNDFRNIKNRKLVWEQSSSTETILADLFQLHDKILRLSELTGGEYGPQSIPFLGACFAFAILGIFLVAKVFFVVGGRSHPLDFVIFQYTLWGLIAILMAYILLSWCSKANCFSKDSAMIVHEIMQKKPAFMLGNDSYYTKMKSFTLQYIHWEGYFQFNALGMFILDYSYMFSIVSAATAYLIVMLQFDMDPIFQEDYLD